MEEVVSGGTELIRLAEGTDKGAGPRPQRRTFHEDSFPRRLIGLPLVNNLKSSTSGSHRPKVTSENESGLYLSLYDPARAEQDSQKDRGLPTGNTPGKPQP